MTLSEENLKSPRVQRKRELARQRILEAAERLFRSQEVEGVTIQEITEAADVGHGTFYTHFKTKMEVLVPIVESNAQNFTRRVDKLTESMEDSAAVVSISIRHLLRAIAKDPLWTWFLSNAQLPMDEFRKGVGNSGRRDILEGVKNKRFTPFREKTLEPFLIGALIGVVRERTHDITNNHAAEDSAQMVLQLLGLDEAEAKQIAYQELPPLPSPGQKQ